MRMTGVQRGPTKIVELWQITSKTLEEDDKREMEGARASGRTDLPAAITISSLDIWECYVSAAGSEQLADSALLSQ